MQKSIDKKKIVLAGGHAASSAFEVIEEVRRENKPWDINWIGFKSTFEGERIATLSSLYFPKYGIKTYTIVSGRLQRKLTIHSVPSLIKIPLGFLHAFILLLRIKPHLVLSFGGFSAFPIVVVANILRIPVILHEQTSVVGRANRYSAFFAKKIAISRETSRPFFPKDKVVLTGNPTPSEIYKNLPRDLPRYPTVFITGGQSGSVAINDCLEKSLKFLLMDFKIVHLTGIKQFHKFKKIRDTFEDELKKRYKVYGIVDPKEFNKFFNSSSFVISRAGANTVSKILAAFKPSILIPLPNSYLAEQEKNAMLAKDFGVARILNQKDFTPPNLLAELKYLVNDWEDYKKFAGKKKSPDKDASKLIVDLMQKSLT